MATSLSNTNQPLAIINAATKSPLTLIKSGGVFKIDESLVSGDLYRDPNNMGVAVVVIKKSIHIDDMDLLTQTA
jgi:hypothetical protein